MYGIEESRYVFLRDLKIGDYFLISRNEHYVKLRKVYGINKYFIDDISYTLIEYEYVYGGTKGRLGEESDTDILKVNK